MKTRGRDSAESLAITAANPLETIPRLRPPPYLTELQCAVWAVVVNCRPADWFTPANAFLLAQYCRHVDESNFIASKIEQARAMPDYPMKDYLDLLKRQENESRVIESLATKMRVSQQATINQRGNKQAATIQGRKLNSY